MSDRRVTDDIDDACDLLAGGDLTLVQSLPWSSNGTWLVSVADGEHAVHAVYKPRDAERPLWDFPTGTLYLREMATFVISHMLGWDLVPPTVLRGGPFGPGSVQRFVPHDPECHFLVMADPDPIFTQRLVAFDVVINNADRKSGHVLRAADGRLWAIDHGFTLHAQPKLRTVIWEYAGQPVPGDILHDLEWLAAGLEAREAGPERRKALPIAPGEGTSDTPAADGAGPFDILADLLSASEIAALRARARRLVRRAVFPGADPRQRMIPWPPV